MFRKRVYEVEYGAMIDGHVHRGTTLVTTRRRVRRNGQLEAAITERAIAAHCGYPELVIVAKATPLSEVQARAARVARAKADGAEMIARIRRESIERFVADGWMSREAADVYLAEKEGL